LGIFLKRLLFIFVLFLLFAPLAEAATDSKATANFSGWKVYHFIDHGGKVCFMATQPQKQEGKFKKRGQAFFFVTRWSGESGRNIVSLSNGYTFKPKSKVTLQVNGRKFTLPTQGDMARTQDKAADDALWAALKKGKTMVVRGISSRGTETTDTYSLKGGTEAFSAVAKECAFEKSQSKGNSDETHRVE
jgi:hypothetical protein